jgi:hypothetical protein
MTKKKDNGHVIETTINPVTGKKVPVRIGGLTAPEGMYLAVVAVFYDGNKARELGLQNLYPWKVGTGIRLCQFEAHPFEFSDMERIVLNGFKYEEKIPLSHPYVELSVLKGTDDDPRTEDGIIEREIILKEKHEELDKLYAARNPRLVTVNKYLEAGYNPREIQGADRHQPVDCNG